MNYFVLTYTGKPIGESGECCGTKYDFTHACKVCGTGAKVKGNLKTKKIKNVKKDFFQTLDGDNIISEKLYHLIKENDIKIDNHKNVVDCRNNTLPYYHFFTDYYLPKAQETKGLIKENECPYCKQNGFFNDIVIGNIENNYSTKICPVILIYLEDNLKILEKSDLINTWEHMGLSNKNKENNLIIRYARPLQIISEKLKKTFIHLKVKDLKFEKIEIHG
jgi:hypothetical protein